MEGGKEKKKGRSKLEDEWWKAGREKRTERKVEEGKRGDLWKT